MSTMQQTTPTDTLPSTVMKLDSSGANWAMFSIHFKQAMVAHKKWGHFDGTVVKPAAADPDKLKEWEEDENTAAYMLSQKLPDSTLAQTYKCMTVVEAWKKIVEEYTRKGIFASGELHKSFLESQCPRGENVRVYLADLHAKRE